MLVRAVAIIASCTAVLSLPPATGRAEDVRLGDRYAAHFQRDRLKFDSEHQRLIAVRASYESEEAVFWADADGRREGAIAPLRDFPDAESFDIGDVAAGPDAVVVSGIVHAGEKRLLRPPRHVILTYDLSGTLRRRWVVNPYHHHQIAVDGRGAVYAMGHSITRERGANLILKYASDGTVEREFLPARFFSRGDDAVMSGSRIGWNQLWVDDDRVLAYIAGTQELFEYDLEGRLQRRTSLAESLAQLARDRRASNPQVVTLVSDPANAALLARVRLDTGKRFSVVLASVPLDGGRPRVLEPEDGSELGTGQMPLVGRDGSARVFINRYTATILRR